MTKEEFKSLKVGDTFTRKLDHGGQGIEWHVLREYRNRRGLEAKTILAFGTFYIYEAPYYEKVKG